MDQAEQDGIIRLSAQDREAIRQCDAAYPAHREKVKNTPDSLRQALYDEFDTTKYQLTTVRYKMESIPEPFVALKSLNESDITFVVRAWVRSTDYWDVYFDMEKRFYTELPQCGFEFAYPHVTINKEN